MSQGEGPQSAGQIDFEPRTLTQAKFELTCENRASVVNPTVQSVIFFLTSFTPRAGLSWIELALQEAIRNAYEHGNLGFSSSEKARLLESDSFDAAVRTREEQQLLQGKSIRINVEISPTEFICSIEDDGIGYDWQEAMRSASSQNLPLEELRGRGLLLIAKVFDAVAFNDAGNKIILKKGLPLDADASA